MLQTCALCGLRDVDLHDNTLQVVLRCRREFFSVRGCPCATRVVALVLSELPPVVATATCRNVWTCMTRTSPSETWTGLG